MSRRLPASVLLAVFLLLVLGPLALARPAAAFGEKTYERNEAVTIANLDVFAGQSVAQSFVATETYRLLRVTLRLQNTGSTTDAINVSLHADDGARPSDTPIASNQVVSGGAIVLVDVNFAGEPLLTGGVRYWIVGTHAGSLAESYRWYHSNGNAYASGWAMTNLNFGAGWVNTTTPTDMYFSTYGRELEANVTSGMSVSRSEANPKDAVTFTVWYNNSGTLAAPQVWVNTTLAPGLTYLSDTASASSTPFPRFTFDTVANGVHAFAVTVLVDIGTEPGTVLAYAADVAFVDSTGAGRLGTSAQAAVTVGLVTKQLYLIPDAPSPHGLTPLPPTGGVAQQTNLTLRRGDPPLEFDLLQPLADTVRGADLEVVLYLDSASDQQENLNINVSLMDWDTLSLVLVASRVQRVTTNNFDDFQRFAFPFNAFTYDFAANHRIRLRVSNLGNSTEDAVLAIASSLANSRLDLRTTTYVRVDGIEVRDAAGPATNWSGKDRFVIRANVSDPFGSPEITAARINITSPSGGLVVDSAGMALLATDPSNPSRWEVFEYAYGPPLANGTYAFEVTGVERNGVLDAAQADAEVETPGFSLAKVASAANVRSGDRFTYRIYANNTGTATATRVWINDTLPSEVLFLGSSDPANMTGSSNWSWVGVLPGSRFLDIEVEVRSGIPQVPLFRNAVSLEFADQKGHSWSGVAAFVDVILNGPVITFQKTVEPSAVHGNEDVTFTIAIANAGDTAQTLWVNDTLPSGLVYVSNDADTLGGTTTFSGGAVRIRFTDMPGSTTWAFHVVARAAAGLPPGAVLANRADLNHTNTNGALMPSREATVEVTFLAPQISGAILSVMPSSVLPGDPVRVSVGFANAGNDVARRLWLNLSLDSLLSFRNASEAATVAGTVVRFALVDLSPGPHRVSLNVSVDGSASEGRVMPITGTIEYEDGASNAFPRVGLVPVSITARGPRIVVDVSPDDVTVEAGRSVAYIVSHSNAGSEMAGDVWLNLSLPASFVYLDDTAAGDLSVSGSQYSWHFADLAPGPHSFALDLGAKPGVPDGGSSDLTFEVEYADANGNLWNGTSATARATFAAPVIELGLTADLLEAHPGDPVRFTLTMRNNGSMPAKTVWLIDAIDSRLEVVSFEARLPATGEPPLNWTFPDVLPGQEEIILLTVRLREGLAERVLIASVLEAYYTNSVGTVIGYERTAPVTIVVPADSLFLPLLVAGAIGLVAAPTAIILRRRSVSIEEVFLVYRDGVLIYHVSRSLVEDKDEDVLSGMLTAVQEFVRDSFRYGERRELHQLDFGDYRIMIERGKLVYLAVVYAGHESAWLKNRVRRVLDMIETTFGDILEKWDGDMDQIIGARDVIRDHLLKPNGRRAKPIPRSA